MPYEYQECTIVDIQQVSDHARIFIIQFPDQHTFQFRPGQFVMLNLPLNSKYTNRAYSIASPPAANNRIELVISLKATGKGTHFLWEHVEIGSIILVSKKALGKFALPENLDRDLCFISTGTGIAPLRSMLLDLFATNKAHGRIHLIFGNRYEKDILYRNEFELLQKSHPEFNFIPVLSRENPGWAGKIGYVHPVYEELYQDKKPAYFYVCGWGEMIKETRMRLQAMGYEKEFIRFETYD
ncbi:MAG: oxidoreductase [Bacteroidia bacterium]|jgi:CDP-4-dehydro-6-deoxyglucose reductase|nr:oxidoreductase [Bacteroidia bacterium]MBP6648796.1 oxidoreductase [Bacteroidia bacterium]